VKPSTASSGPQTMLAIEKLNNIGRIAVWGIGYLGYTTMARCQRFGLLTDVWAPEQRHLMGLEQGHYPGRELQIAWSDFGTVPGLSLQATSMADSPESLLSRDIPVHVLALPNHADPQNRDQGIWRTIADAFCRHAPRDRKILVLLTSAPVPGDTGLFVERLGDLGENVRVVAAFRSDWMVEDYLCRPQPQALGGDAQDQAAAAAFLQRIGIPSFSIGTYHDAEVYQAFMSSFRCLASAFVSQFAFAYPNNPVNRIASAALACCDLSRVRPTIGFGGKQMMTGIEHLFRGSSYNDLLTLVKEAQAFNLSSILFYADMLARRGSGRVGILGITPQPDNLDLAFSPSILLAEALLKRGLTVYVHDPHFAYNTIEELMPGVRHLDLDKPQQRPVFEGRDAIVLMTPHRYYLAFTQQDIDRHVCGQAGLVLDNTGAWQHLKFSKDTRYHFIGSGALDINA